MNTIHNKISRCRALLDTVKSELNELELLVGAPDTPAAEVAPPAKSLPVVVKRLAPGTELGQGILLKKCQIK